MGSHSTDPAALPSLQPRQNLRISAISAVTISPRRHSDGTRPRNAISSRGWPKRVRSPSSATRPIAVMNETPRSARFRVPGSGSAWQFLHYTHVLNRGGARCAKSSGRAAGQVAEGARRRPWLRRVDLTRLAAKDFSPARGPSSAIISAIWWLAGESHWASAGAIAAPPAAKEARISAEGVVSPDTVSRQ